MAKTALKATGTVGGTPQPAKKSSGPSGPICKLYTKGTDRPVYAGPGVPRERAVELASMLVDTPDIRPVAAQAA